MKLAFILALATLALAAPSPPPKCEQCRPLPGENKCDITTSCIYNWGHVGSGGPYYCACRAGYRATDPKDASKQFRLPWYGEPSQEGRVFARPGVVCDTLCDQWWLGPKGCAEVTLRKECM